MAQRTSVLLTRPKEDALCTAKLLHEKEIEAHTEPMLAIEPMQEVLPALERAMQGARAVIVTSHNALKLMEQLPDKDILLLTVGESTAQCAREVGFEKAVCVGEDVQELKDMIVTTQHPEHGKLVYASGDVVKTDLEAILKPIGFTIERVVVYQAKASEALSKATIELLKDKKLTGILFYSTRSAEVFMQLAAQAGVIDTLSTLTAYCMSQNVAAALEDEVFATVKVAKAPTEEALLGLLK